MLYREPGYGRCRALGNASRVAALMAQADKLEGGWPWPQSRRIVRNLKRAGLRELGSGAYKMTFTDERFVYKVGDIWSLREEFDAANHYRAAGHAWAAPTSMWRDEQGEDAESGELLGHVVLVQPLYIGEEAIRENLGDGVWRDVSYRACRVERQMGMGDMHEQNYGATRHGHLRVWDLG